MSLATPNLRICFAGSEQSVRRFFPGRRVAQALVLAAIAGLAGFRSSARRTDDFTAEAARAFQQARDHYQAQPQSTEAAWQFGRACFDLADCATNNTQRADVANLGIAACQKA